MEKRNRQMHFRLTASEMERVEAEEKPADAFPSDCKRDGTCGSENERTRYQKPLRISQKNGSGRVLRKTRSAGRERTGQPASAMQQQSESVCKKGK